MSCNSVATKSGYQYLSVGPRCQITKKKQARQSNSFSCLFLGPHFLSHAMMTRTVFASTEDKYDLKFGKNKHFRTNNSKQSAFLYKKSRRGEQRELMMAVRPYPCCVCVTSVCIPAFFFYIFFSFLMLLLSLNETKSLKSQV